MSTLLIFLLNILLFQQCILFSYTEVKTSNKASVLFTRMSIGIWNKFFLKTKQIIIFFPKIDIRSSSIDEQLIKKRSNDLSGEFGNLLDYES